MPACRASQLRSPLLSSSRLRSAQPRRAAVHRPACGCGLRRWASTAPTALRSPTEDTGTSHNKTRTILHKAEALLPRILSDSAILPESTRLAFWKDALNGAYVDLNSAAGKGPVRVVVYGCDEHSGARNLVTALLEEPFAPPSRNEAIRERWKDTTGGDTFYISHGFTQSGEANRLRFPSNWMQQFHLPLEIGELSSTSKLPARALFAADIPVIVCNPITTPLPTVLSNPCLPLTHGNAILVITSSPASAPEYAELLAKELPPTLKILFVDPARALEATQTLASSSASPAAVQQYQDNFTGARVSDLTSAIAERITAGSGNTAVLHAYAAKELTKLSLTACRNALHQASKDVDKVVLGVIDLKDKVAELEARTEGEVLGLNASAVEGSMEKAKKEVRTVMDRLTWWRFVWRVDDVGDIVTTAVDKAWCRDLEDRLIFHGGRLACAQQALAAAANHLVASYPPSSPFHSPVLVNQLEQLQTSPSYPVKPASLTVPIHTRRAQMLYPTNMLQRTAQQVTLGMGTSVLTGCGIAWAGWAEHLGILGGALSTGMQVETAVGAGMLVVALGMRLMVGKWDKAKKRWWRDWDRVGQGLERDLKGTLNKVVADQVAVVSQEASDGLNQLANKRKDEIDTLTEELDALEQEAKAV